MNVLVHHARADEARIETHLEALRTLGVELHTSSLDEATATGGVDAFDVYYISAGSLAPACVPQLRERVRGSAPRAALLVFLDAVELAPDLDALLKRFNSLAGYSAASGALLRKLTRSVLEAIDELSGATVRVQAPEDATVVLPAALVISCDEQKFLVPQDYMGLVTLGRGANCQVRLDSGVVSRLHGCFRTSSEGFHYRDLSSNGTTLLQDHEETLLHDDEVVLPARCALRIGDRVVSLQIND